MNFDPLYGVPKLNPENHSICQSAIKALASDEFDSKFDWNSLNEKLCICDMSFETHTVTLGKDSADELARRGLSLHLLLY